MPRFFITFARKYYIFPEIGRGGVKARAPSTISFAYAFNSPAMNQTDMKQPTTDSEMTQQTMKTLLEPSRSEPRYIQADCIITDMFR